MNQLVSIIIPTYNRAHLISETLDSILAQTYANWECIIVDDGSTDDTEKRVNDFIKRDSRFVFLKRKFDKKKGASSCRNIGLENSIGNYIQFLDSDDIMSVDKLKNQVKILENKDEMDFAFCMWGRFIHSMKDAIKYENLNIYRTFTNAIELLNSLTISKGYLPLHAFLFHKKLIDKAGLWNENLTINDDGDFISKIYMNFNKAIYCDNSFVLYRISENENNLSTYNNESKVLSVIVSWEIIFRNYNTLFRGKESKYKIYIKKGVYINTRKFVPQLLNHRFFNDLKFYIIKENAIALIFKIKKHFLV